MNTRPQQPTYIFHWIFNLFILCVVSLTLRPLVAFAEPSTASDSAKSSENLQIRIDDKKGIEIKGLDHLKEKLKKLESLKAIKVKDDSVKVDLSELEKDMEGLEKDLENLGQEMENLEIQWDGANPSVTKKRGKPFNFQYKTHLDFATTVISIMPFIMIILLVALILYFRHRNRREALETLRTMVEKGQSVTPEVLSALGMNQKQNLVTGTQNHWLSGLKPLFWGFGVLVFFVFNSLDIAEYFIGLIPILIGAYLITRSYLMDKHQKNQSADVIDNAKDL